MIVFNKTEIRQALNIEDIFQLLVDWGGEPEYSNFGIISTTICHNKPGVGSKKLYYYENSDLFKCYTGCDSSFDIFELTIKVFEIQFHQKIDLNEAVRYIAFKHGISGSFEESIEPSELDSNWDILSNYDRIQNLELKEKKETFLKEYDKEILYRFNYDLKLTPWLEENILQEILDYNQIGFYPGGNQITIPHFDIENKLVGIRGRTLSQEEGSQFGKYRPLYVNRQWYNHPLGLNLYNLNHSKSNISIMRKVIIFEGEKSVYKYQSYFGIENDISVACCGSSISAYQIQLLLNYGAEEIIIAFDRQFQEIGDEEFKRLTKNLLKIREKYKNYATISFIFDKNMITGYKDSPIDCGKEIFLKLFNERITL